MNIEEKIKKIVTDKFVLTKYDPNGKFIEYYGGDSLDTVELALTVEDVFNIEIPEEILEGFSSPNQVILYLKSVL